MDKDLSEFVPKEDSWHKKRGNGAYLTDYQVKVLRQNGIDVNMPMNAILMEINDILLEEDNEELELVSKELDEINYYNSKKN
jgi:hypothetical protein